MHQRVLFSHQSHHFTLEALLLSEVPHDHRSSQSQRVYSKHESPVSHQTLPVTESPHYIKVSPLHRSPYHRVLSSITNPGQTGSPARGNPWENPNGTSGCHAMWLRNSDVVVHNSLWEHLPRQLLVWGNHKHFLRSKMTCKSMKGTV